MTVSSAYAADKVAAFVHTPSSDTKGLKTGATLNWLLRQQIKASLAQKGWKLHDRGMFFSRSQAISAARWRKQARSTLEEAQQTYHGGKPSEASDTLFRAARFFEFAHKYYLDNATFQRALFYLGLSQFRQGEKEAALRYLAQGWLLKPDAKVPGQFGEKEKALLRASRCLVGRSKAGKIKVIAKPNAELYLNGRLMGFGSMTLSVPAGTHLVQTIQDGARNWGKKVRISPGASRTARARNRRSPRSNVYGELCTALLGVKQGDKANLANEMGKVAYRLGVKRVMVGCFQSSGEDKGTLRWFAMSGPKAVVQGSESISAAMTQRMKALSAGIRAAGLTASSAVSAPPSRYPFPVAGGTCPDAMKMSLVTSTAKSPGSRRQPPTPRTSSPWTPSIGDPVVIYTKFGFRLQGKVLAIKGVWLTLAVARGKKDPNALRSVRIHHDQVRLSWILGTKQRSGFHVGEHLVVETRYGFQISGRLLSENREQVQIKTKAGTTSIPWRSIARVIRRDR